MLSFVSSRAAHNGVPSVDPAYGTDVEQWWASHPFNPDGTNYDPVITSPDPQLNVADYGNNIQSAINALPAAGGTIILPPGTYAAPGAQTGRSNIHLLAPSGATLSANMSFKIAAGPIAAGDYGAYNTALYQRNAAAVEDFTHPARNWYFKNITFDGGLSAYRAMTLSTCRDFVWENCRFQNFNHHAENFHWGEVTGNCKLINLWFRNCTFSGGNVTGPTDGAVNWAVYWDGAHACGMIGCRVEKRWNSGGFLFLTNDDFTEDMNSNGIWEDSEQRQANYCVIYDCTFANTVPNGIAMHGANSLIAKNAVLEGSTYFASFNGRCSNRWSSAGLVYKGYGNKVVNNLLTNCTYVSYCDNNEGIMNCTSPLVYGRLGKHTVRCNQVTGSTTLNYEGVLVDGPNLVFGNCVNSPGCAPQCSVPETIPPTVPGNLRSTNVTETAITLAWDPASDNTAVAGYVIYRNGTYVAMVSGGSYPDTGLIRGTTYQYTVTAYDTYAQESGASTPGAVKTLGFAEIPFTWENADIGGPVYAGSGTVANGVYTVRGGGSDIWYSPDVFHFMYGTGLSGDGEIIARVVSIQNTNNWAKAGLMMRQSLAADASYAMADVTANSGVSFQYRLAGNGEPGSATVPYVYAPYWVRMVRQGNQFTGFASSDGVAWTQLGSSVIITMGATPYVGLAVTAHNNNGLCTAVFDNVKVLGNLNTNPAPTAPGNLRVMTYSDRGVRLSWDAASDDTGVAGYKIYRNGAYLASAALLAYSDTTVSANTSYSYQVTAYDSQPRESPPSNTVAVKTPNGADLNTDAGVNGADLNLLLQDWLAEGDYLLGDISHNLKVDLGDFGLLSGAWSQAGPITNLVLNPSLDNDSDGNGIPDNWLGVLGGGLGQLDSGVARSGGKSFRGIRDGYNYQTILLTPGQAYQMKGWLKTQGADGPGRLRYVQLQPPDIFWSGALTGSVDWTEVSGTFTTSSNFASGRLDMIWEQANGFIWYDDISLEPM